MNARATPTTDSIIQHKLCKALLDSLSTGDTILAVNGRHLTYQGLSSDKHNYLFEVDGLEGNKVYDSHGVPSALGSNLNIDVSGSMLLIEEKKKPVTKGTSTSKAHDLASNWLIKAIQVGLIKKGSIVQTTKACRSGNRTFHSIYKGLSSRGNPIFTTKGEGTCEYKANGVKAFKVPGLAQLQMPVEMKVCNLANLFDNLQVGDKITTLNDMSGRVCGLTSTEIHVSFGEKTHVYTKRGVIQKSDDMSTIDLVKLALVSTKTLDVALEVTKRYHDMVEISPHIFVGKNLVKKNNLQTSMPKPLPKEKVAKVIEVKAIPTVEQVDELRAKVVTTAPEVMDVFSAARNAIEQILSEKVIYAVVTQDGEILKRLKNGDDPQFEATQEANRNPGKEVFLISMNVIGSAVVPKPQAVFKAL